ncbi:MAG: cyclodeaminase/cyclohydrolase family protein, partial [Planctomycetota bacterium]
DAGPRLVDRSVTGFVEETAAESPAPGGGSVSATIGALGAALTGMVANLSSHKRGWDDRWEEFSGWAEKAKACQEELLRLIDEDTAAFNGLMAAFGLSKGTDAEKRERDEAIQAATRKAIDVPFRVMEVALECMATTREMASIGLPSSVSDAGVAAVCARGAVLGAFLNVKINARGLGDGEAVSKFLSAGASIEERAKGLEKEILGLVEAKISG